MNVPRGTQFVHDALVAGFLTLLAAIAFDLGLFSQSDTQLFAEVSDLLAQSYPRSTDHAIVVEIDQRTFEARFGGGNPLDRAEIASVIEALASEDKTPSVENENPNVGKPLAIDLDLSPRNEDLAAFNLTSCADVEQTEEAKRRWPIERALCSSALPLIVLIAPFPTDGEQAVAKLRWMTFICGIQGNKVDFALAYIPPPVGPYTVGYYKKASTLAGVIAGKPGLCGKVPKQWPTEDATARARPTSVPIDLAFLNRAVAGANQGELPVQYLSGAEAELLNFRLQVDSVPLSRCAADGCRTYLRDAGTDRTVLFLGGTWDATGADEFFTPLGRIPGLHLHAIAYADAKESDSLEAPKLAALAAEFAVGLALIALFRRVWRASDRALDSVLVTWDARNGFARARAVSIYAVSVLTVPVVVVLVAVLLLSALAVSLSLYLWMAPTALLVSVLVKSYIERPDRGFEFASRAWWWERVPHLFVALYGLVIVVGLLVKG